jgi:drug/metabolite transporter (DMT)-like permease
MQRATDKPTTRSAAPGVPPSAGRDRLRAIGLMILAVSMFACLDATAKYLVTRAQLPLVQVVWMRFLGQMAMVVLTLGLIAMPRLLSTRKLGPQLFRSFLLLASTLLNFAALRTLRLDQTLTIQFLAPLLVALLAGPLLGEWVGWRRMLAIITGFVGILVVIRPGFEAVPPGVAYALACMLAYTCFILITRYISAYDPADVTLTYSMFAGVVAMAPFALEAWVWPSDALSLVLAVSPVSGARSGIYLILAYRLAPASTVAPFLYTQLLDDDAARLHGVRRPARPLDARRFGDRDRVRDLSVHREQVKKVPPRYRRNETPPASNLGELGAWPEPRTVRTGRSPGCGSAPCAADRCDVDRALST